LPTEQSLFWKCAQVIGQILTRLLFDLKVIGRSHVPKNGGVLIVSNHQTYLDPVLLGAFLQRPLNFVAKSELFRHPLAAWALRRLNAFPLRQGKGDIGALKETIRRLREGHLLNIFPEGARSPDGRIHPFQKGVALILRRANVPVVPAVIVGSYAAWPSHCRIWRRAPIRVKFGPPLKLDAMHSDDDITAAIERELRRMFQEMQQSPRQPGILLPRPAFGEIPRMGSGGAFGIGSPSRVRHEVAERGLRQFCPNIRGPSSSNSSTQFK
jgi:1-acyl-sn-glycerol-3-phosphate acyltransferase